jgi:catalase
MSIKDVPREIQIRQIQHFLNADERYGRGIAEGLGYEGKAILELEVLAGSPK